MKRRFIGSVMALMLTLALLPSATSTAGETSTAGDVNSFALTRNEKENIMFMFDKNMMTIANLPDDSAFRSVWVNISDKDGRVQIKQTLSRDKGGSATLSLRSLNEGYYYIELFFHIGDNKYSSYMFGDQLGFNWKNGNGSFVLSPIYKHNMEIYKSGRSDSAALENYLKQTDLIQSANAGIIKQAKEITEGITGDYNKARAIHDWVCANVWYVWDASTLEKRLSGDAASALSTRLATCIGYSNLTAALLRAVGIPTKIVSGHGRDDSKTGEWTQSQQAEVEVRHFWNEAYVDGRWIIIDTTWDSGNDYEGGKKTASGGLYFSRYFDATIEAFSMDHYMNDYGESSITPPAAPSPLRVFAA